MVTALWRQFPRLMEQNINGLLDGAQPTALKAFQLYRTCQNEGLFTGNLTSFARYIEEYFSRPRSDRRKSHFDAYLERPMSHETYSRFQVNFRTAVVNEKSLNDVASWAHNLIRVATKSTGSFLSLEVITKTLRNITEPSPFDKAENIEFSDFCVAWKKTVFKFFGNKQDSEFQVVLDELRWLDTELKKAEARALHSQAIDPQSTSPISPVIALTQTEIDWTLAVQKAAFDNDEAPRFPLSRGPEKVLLKELERIVSLYQASKTSNHPEVVKNRDRIRATLIDRCEILLGNKKAAA